MNYNFKLSGQDFLNILVSKKMEEQQVAIEEELKNKYKETYPEDKEFAKYINIEHDLDGVSYIFPMEYYVAGEDDLVLKPEYQNLLDNGLVKPSYELWKEDVENDYQVDVDKVLMLGNVKDFLSAKVEHIADVKHAEAEASVSDKKNISDKQINRYEVKYELAKKAKTANDFSQFDLEAKLQGITAEALVDLIIANGEKWSKAVDTYKLLIEAIRVKMQDEISKLYTEDQIAQIDNILNTADKFGANIIPEQVEQLFKG